MSSKTSEQQRQNISLESGRLGSLNIKIQGPLGKQAVFSVFYFTGLHYLKQVHKLTNERLQEKLNQGIGEGMEQIAVSHSPG